MWAHISPLSGALEIGPDRKPKYRRAGTKVWLEPKTFQVVVLPLHKEAVTTLRAAIHQAINWGQDGEEDFKTSLDISTDGVMDVLRMKRRKR